MSFAGDLMRFAHELEQNDNAAFDLWTWLPSHKKAEDCLGDYYIEVQPSQNEIMKEARRYIAHGCNPTQEQLDNDYQYQCPCNGDCPKQR